MNYLKAAQRQKGGRWDFTCTNDGKVWPVGYCQGDSGKEHYTGEHPEKFHNDGHETAEEAALCYHQYTLDTALRFGRDSNQQRKCHKCGEWTQGVGFLGTTTLLILCEAHQTRGVVEELTSPSTQIWSS